MVDRPCSAAAGDRRDSGSTAHEGNFASTLRLRSGFLSDSSESESMQRKVEGDGNDNHSLMTSPSCGKDDRWLRHDDVVRYLLKKRGAQTRAHGTLLGEPLHAMQLHDMHGKELVEGAHHNRQRTRAQERRLISSLERKSTRSYNNMKLQHQRNEKGGANLPAVGRP